MNPECESLQDRLGYSFSNAALLEAALTHPSYRHETAAVNEDNQRLEFLGDAALGLAAAQYLYAHHPDWPEGHLTKARSLLTNSQTLAQVAAELGIGPLIRFGRGEELTGGASRPSNLADAMEALLGAVLLDGGLDRVRGLFLAHFAPLHAEDVESAHVANPKGQLLELCQKRSRTAPVYVVLEESGPSHQRNYTVEVRLGSEALGAGSGSSKREAEALAATHALQTLLDD